MGSWLIDGAAFVRAPEWMTGPLVESIGEVAERLWPSVEDLEP